MGIRGTAFDFTVTGTDRTDLVVYDGEVRFCGARRQCAVVPGGCNTVTLARDNAFVLPGSVEEKVAQLGESFPYLRSQAQLLPPFQLGADGCSDENEVALPREQARVERDGPDDADADDGRGGNPAE
jgi:hypothetical protein